MSYSDYMKNFKAEKVKDDIVHWIRKTFEINGPDCNAIIGISGGKDSTVVAALCVEALGRDRVIGVLMPNGVEPDYNVAAKVVNFFGIKNLDVDIATAYGDIIWQLPYVIDKDGRNSKVITKVSEQTKTNLPARLRMATLYAIAQSANGRVMNTCNLSEDYIGYSTRYGDSVGDFSPLANLTTDEVIAIGKACGLPDEFVYKVPTDGLCGKTDEENFGFTYATLNEYIRMGVCEDEEIRKKIDNLHEKNLFKLQPMPTFKY